LCKNCILKHGIQGKIREGRMRGRRGRRSKKLLDDLRKEENAVN
jgi:hypothetical protein